MAGTGDVGNAEDRIAKDGDAVVSDIHWRYTPDDYDVGSDLWIAEAYGWYAMKALRYRVTRKTPKGQLSVEADANGVEHRLTASGKIVGGGAWDRRRIVSAEMARKYNEEVVRDNQWRNIFPLTEAVEKAARNRDPEELQEKQALLADAVRAVLAQKVQS
jgi:hypothetical protein